MTSTGHFPTAVSPVTITAAAPSATALKISLTSARVGTGFCSMDASICVTTMNGFPALRPLGLDPLLGRRQLPQGHGIPQIPSGNDDLIRRFQKFRKPFQPRLVFDLGE